MVKKHNTRGSDNKAAYQAKGSVKADPVILTKQPYKIYRITSLQDIKVHDPFPVAANDTDSHI